MKIRYIATLSLSLVLVLGTSGCGFLDKVKAKDRLNKAAQAYNQGNYDAALQLLEEALQIDSTLPNLKPYYGATLYAKYNLGGDEQYLRKALDVYLEISQEQRQKDPPDTEGLKNTYAYLTTIYNNMGEKDKAMGILEERLAIPGLSPRDQAEIHYTIGATLWRDSFEATQKYMINQIPEPVYRIPDDQVPKVRQFVDKGLKHLNEALVLSPDYIEPWSYINLMYRELAKLESDPQQKQRLTKQADEARNKYMELKKQQQPAAAAVQ